MALKIFLYDTKSSSCLTAGKWIVLNDVGMYDTLKLRNIPTL